ncbi:hypothetical protein AB1L42_00070 [Thalassoglobus sp. JC818]|uniref:hypothetical protein n=1 Tax=Thalassoglobus sp. JC818 TaxID=3232136 RepID=UPI00345B2AA3
MSLTLTSNAPIPYVSTLQSLVHQAVDEVRWLVIAHRDPLIMRALRKGIGRETMIIVDWPEENELTQSSDLVKAIQWAIQEKRIPNIVLLEHSGSSGVKSSYDTGTRLGILAGTSRAIDQNREAQIQFSKVVKMLRQSSEIQDCVDNSNASLHFLFFRAIDGAFLTFDEKCGEFLPVTNESPHD